MSTEEKLQVQLPDWLIEAIEAGEPLEGVPARRAQSRLHAWSFPCRIVPVGGDPSASFTSNLQKIAVVYIPDLILSAVYYFIPLFTYIDQAFFNSDSIQIP